jgi:molecular chaperone DnaK (HSP70)
MWTARLQFVSCLIMHWVEHMARHLLALDTHVADAPCPLPAPLPQKNEGIDLRKDRQALQRLTEAAEKAKIELSATTQTSINLPFITATADGPKHIDQMLTKAKFEEICNDLLTRCKRPVEQALKDAKLSISDIQEVRR